MDRKGDPLFMLLQPLPERLNYRLMFVETLEYWKWYHYINKASGFKSNYLEQSSFECETFVVSIVQILFLMLMERNKCTIGRKSILLFELSIY